MTEQCQACSIQIGPDYIEEITYQVGKFSICGWCLGKLEKEGHIELDGRKPIANEGIVCHFLYPDGGVKRMRVVSIKEPKPDVLFVPLIEGGEL